MQHISILIKNHSGKYVKLPRNNTLGYVAIIDSLEPINLTMKRLIEKELSQIIEDKPIKSPMAFGMDSSLDENTKNASSKLPRENVVVFATSNDGL